MDIFYQISYILYIASIFLFCGSILFLFHKNIIVKSGLTVILLGILFYIFYVIILWTKLERPPFRTLGETRLWYSIFLSIIGVVIYFRWKYRWILSLSIFFALLFTLINLLNPANFDKNLMPALNSIWFIPHTIVYILSYSILASATLLGIYALWQYYYKKIDVENIITKSDNIIYIAFSFLTLGLLFGALWAKEAWGHYWTWDPKETWAFITWFIYLIYIHYRKYYADNKILSLWILIFAFVIVIICWFGINYLPSAANSIHTYTN